MQPKGVNCAQKKTIAKEVKEDILGKIKAGESVTALPVYNCCIF